jgi:hypothetical protein
VVWTGSPARYGREPSLRGGLGRWIVFRHLE